MKSLIQKFSLLILCCLTAQSFAADFANCSVLEVITAGEKNAHFRLDCIVSTRPACASAGNYVGFDKSSVEGQDYLVVGLIAFSTGAKLTGYVHDTVCSPTQGNVAWLRHLRMTH